MNCMAASYRRLNVRQGHALAGVFTIGVKDVDFGAGEIIIREARATKIGIPPYRKSENGIGASLSAKSNERGLVAGRCKEWETLSTGGTAQSLGQIDSGS